MEILESKSFRKGFDKLVGRRERNKLYNHLLCYPEDGDLIQGGGGLRKLRWSRPKNG